MVQTEYSFLQITFIQICTRFYDVLNMKYGPDWMFILLWNSEIVKS